MSFLPLLLSFPLFIVLMLLEYYLAKTQGQKNYSKSETLSNLLCGIGHLACDSIFRVGIFSLYNYFYADSLFQIESSALSAIGLLILIDFIYYWYHRLSHNINIFWMIHRVHHQSEYYNYSVGLRQAWFHKLSAFWIYVPPAFLGFSSSDYILVASLHAIAQIWTHTNLYHLGPLSKMSWINKFLVTPSHHHLHHATNKEYLNSNYGGILSIWDHLFGTTVVENNTVKVKYGVNDNIYFDEVNDVVASNWQRLYNELKKASSYPTTVQRLKVLFSSPGAYPSFYKKSESIPSYLVPLENK